MKFIISIHAYDVIDQVTYTARVKAYDDYEHDSGALVFEMQGSFPGRGEDDALRWAGQLLQEMSKAL